MFTQSATKDGGALASWRMDAPASDCVNLNSRPSTRLGSSYLSFYILTNRMSIAATCALVATLFGATVPSSIPPIIEELTAHAIASLA